jgi:hypothetical protein
MEEEVLKIESSLKEKPALDLTQFVLVDSPQIPYSTSDAAPEHSSGEFSLVDISMSC